ncbi:unnamed protein product [Cuscuta epithymum]|uniref:Secreted protein n=1 Tax=Cuscuta epithymum TaxID=186058 RepID=A0AAV0FBY8_9ASTE|nr:unnamed protein product [Cuscuta epithymum]
MHRASASTGDGALLSICQVIPILLFPHPARRRWSGSREASQGVMELCLCPICPVGNDGVYTYAIGVCARRKGTAVGRSAVASTKTQRRERSLFHWGLSPSSFSSIP